MDWKAENSKANQKKRMLTVADVATQCGVCQRTVTIWIANDGLPVHRVPGRGSKGIIRIAQEDLDIWLAQFRHNAAHEKEERERTVRLDGRSFIVSRQKEPFARGVLRSGVPTREDSSR